jgi:23S rRNA pseudouridine2605 synthase
LRLNVYLQKAGIGSRREAERAVAEGRVRINGSLATATTPVNEGDAVKIDGKRVGLGTRALPRLFLLHKPVDILCTLRDPKGRPTIYDLDALKRTGLPRLMYVGRLDVNSEGLLLMSSDGPLAQALTSPEAALRRVYRVRLRGRLNDRAIAEIRRGLTIDGVSYRGAELVEEKEGSGRSNTWYRITLTEGKNREIRKIAAHFGSMVNRLIRVEYGPFALGKLPPGAMDEATPGKVAAMLALLENRIP